MLSAFMLATAIAVPAPIIISEGPQPRGLVAERSAPRPAIEYQVEVRAGSQVLFNDTLRVGTGGAHFSQQKTESPKGICPPGRLSFTRQLRSSINVRLTPVGYGRDPEQAQLSVQWERPAANARCDGDVGSRTASITQSLSLAPGEEQTAAGDGGLAVRVRRASR